MSREVNLRAGDLNIMLVGNNPSDLAVVFETLKKIQQATLVTEIAFDLSGIIKLLGRFRPAFIIIDDNIGQEAMDAAVQKLIHHRKTRNIPITVIKNSNYQESINRDVMNYILKNTMTADSLYKALLNSVKFRKTLLFLQESYRKRKGKLKKLALSYFK